MFLLSPSSHVRLSAVLIVMLLSWIVLAGTGQKPAQRTGKIGVTGCLREGNVAGRFTVKARDGKEYALRSASLKLADYIGRTVSIKGRIKRDPGRDEYDFEGSEVNEEYGKKVLDPVDVDVDALKVVRKSCQ